MTQIFFSDNQSLRHPILASGNPIGRQHLRAQRSPSRASMKAFAFYRLMAPTTYRPPAQSRSNDIFASM